MNPYYLMAQLPSLDAVNEAAPPPPITEARFYELCDRFLGKRALSVLRDLRSVPDLHPRATGVRLVDAWNDAERQLRLALWTLRAEKMKKDVPSLSETPPAQILQAARTVVGMQDPLEAERFLYHFRLSFLESLRPSDPFCEAMVFYYALKLKLLLRMQRLDPVQGEAAYRSIYHSILRGEEEVAE